MDVSFGLTHAVPVLLQSKGVTYAEQAWFSFVFFSSMSKI